MKIYRKKEGLKESLAGSDLFISSEAGEQLLVLNKTALFIWSLCEDHDASEMVAVLAKIYPEIPAGRLRTDIQDCLAGFLEKKLIAAYGD